MKLQTIGNHYRRFLLTVILTVIAAILLVAGILITKNANKGYIETTATIVDITSEQGIDPEDTVYHAYVDYTVDGTEYHHIALNTYDGTYKVGKQVTVMYNPQNPAEIVGKNPSWLPIVLFVAAGVLFVGAIASIVFAVRANKKAKDMAAKPVISDEGREMGAMQKLYFSWDTKTPVKMRFYIDDENRNLLYEGKMTHFNAVAPHTYLFVDHVNHAETEHKVGHVNEADSGSITVSQGFTFDGVEMNEYLTANHIRVTHGMSNQGIALSFNIYFNDTLIATAESSSRYAHEDDKEAHPHASKLRLNQYFYEIVGQVSYVDVIFLALFRETQAPRLGSLLG